MRKLLKMIVGLCLLPMCWAISISVYKLYQTSVEITTQSGWDAWALPIGFILWVVIFFLLPRPMRTYVLGHELTHALWALMMGGRVGNIKVTATGGQVELSKTNFIVTLAPYFFPFYTFLIIAAYYLTGLAVDVEPYRVWWLGAVGFTWAFHITFTMQMLSEHQPDVQAHGRIFSYTVIYCMNALFIALWMILVGSPRFETFVGIVQHEVATVSDWVCLQLFTAWGYLAEFIANQSA